MCILYGISLITVANTTWVLHTNHMGITSTPHGYYMHTTWVSHVNHMEITCTPHGYYMHTTWVSHVNHVGITCTPHGYYMHTTWVSHVNHMETTCTPHGHYMHIRWVSHVNHIGFTWTPHKYHMSYTLTCLTVDSTKPRLTRAEILCGISLISVANTTRVLHINHIGITCTPRRYHIYTYLFDSWLHWSQVDMCRNTVWD